MMTLQGKSPASLIKCAAVLLAGLLLFQPLQAAEPPSVGDKAPNFSLNTLDGYSFKLAELTSKGKVVLVVLRGWPGYQCPACDAQAHDFIAHHDAFKETGAQLVFVYPGPAEDLLAHAEEFETMNGREWPSEYVFALDPEYSMINQYGLRWEAENETAYPSTFVLDENRTVHYALISKTHGGRAKAADVIAELKKLD